MRHSGPLVGRRAQLDALVSGVTGDATRGMLVAGEAGVGKTRLVHEAADRVEALGGVVRWVRATEAGRAIPLAPVLHLLPDDRPPGGVHELVRSAVRLAGTPGTVIVFDDAHLLDDASVTFAHLLLTDSRARVLATVRADAVIPDPLVRLWRDGLVERLDLGPLQRAEVAAMARASLGRSLTAERLDRLWRLSRGNALFVTELLRAAADGTDLDSVPSRLAELVEARHSQLDDTSRQALDLVAVAEPLPLTIAERVAAVGDLEGLEAKGLLVTDDRGREPVLRASHPLHGEVLREGVGPLRRRGLFRLLVAALGEHDHDVDPLRSAVWRLEAGGDEVPERRTEAAWAALRRFDHVLAERLARAAYEAGDSDGALALAEALAGQRRHDEADEVLASLIPAGPGELARVSIARATHAFRRGQPEGALDRLRGTERRLAAEPALRSDCRSHRALLAMAAGRVEEALDAAGGVLDEPDAPDSATLRAAVAGGVLWSAQGRTDRIIRDTDDWLRLATEHSEIPMADLVLRLNRFLALVSAGHIRRAVTLAEDDLGMSTDDAPGGLAAILVAVRGRASFASGHPRTALGLLRQAEELARNDDWLGLRPWILAFAARSAVFAGAADEARELIVAGEASLSPGALTHALARANLDLSSAWLAAGDGDLRTAGELAIATGRASEGLSRAVAVDAFHDAARLGDAHSAQGAIDGLTRDVEGPWVRACRDHAAALATGEPEPLGASAARFEELGAHLIACEAWLRAEQGFRAAGRRGSAADAREKAERLRSICERPWVPVLQLDADAEPLTYREQEIATLAAGGRSSKQIAGELRISVRTVDTHLGRVYRKLGVEGRSGLASSFDR